MTSKILEWWQKTKKPLEIVAIIFGCLIVITLLVVIALTYIFNVNVPGLHGKTLWDWLQLLIIPAVLAVAGYIINLTISKSEQEATKQRAQSEQEAAEKRAETERKIAEDNQREEVLQTYIDKMSELLFSAVNAEMIEPMMKVGRVRTLSVLRRLDGKRKGIVLQFLHESGLIDYRGIRYIDLSGADLTKANLMGANLTGADLSKANLNGAFMNRANMDLANMKGANLRGARLGGTHLIKVNLTEANLTGANLIGTDLTEANLTGANLTEANLFGANLTGAKLFGVILTGADLSKANLTKTFINLELLDNPLLKGATMSDGSIHQ